MVTLAQSSPGDRSACAPQGKTATVVLAWLCFFAIFDGSGYAQGLVTKAADLAKQRTLRERAGKLAEAEDAYRTGTVALRKDPRSRPSDLRRRA